MEKVKDTVSEFMKFFGRVQTDPILYDDHLGMTLAIDTEDLLRSFCDFLEQRQETRPHETIVNGTKWTSVEDEPLADITIERDEKSTSVTYDNYLVGVDMLFAVPLGNGEYSICRGYIEDDGSIQESFQSGENEWWGYSLEDVTHYMQIFNPK